MSSAKRLKKDHNDDDEVIIIDSPPRLTSDLPNELCQHLDQITKETCREYYSVLCLHCNLSLCYTHIEIHRLLLLNERDQLINELNERIDRLDHLMEHPDRIQKLVIDKIEQQNQQKISFLQQIAMEKSLDLKNIIVQLKELFQPIRRILEQTHSISVLQIRKIQQSFLQFDENQNVNRFLLGIVPSQFSSLYSVVIQQSDQFSSRSTNAIFRSV